MQVELYSRKDSAPCAEARALLERVRAEIPFDLIEVDIDQDPKLRAQFDADVPVVYVDGRKAFKRAIVEKVLVQKLERGRAFAMGMLDPRANLTRGRPVGRQTKLIFAAVALLGLGGVFVNTAVKKLILDPALEVRALEITKEDFPAPAFALADALGTKRSLADYRGKVVFVNFWATWCAPCREEMPDMEKMARALARHEDFAMLAVSVDDGWAPIQQFFEERKPPFTVLLDEGANVSKAYGTSQYPESYVIDRKGVVIAKFVGARDWSDPATVNYMERLLN